MSDDRLCSKCQQKRVQAGQRWCRACKNEAKRASRRAKQALRVLERRNAVVKNPVHVPVENAEREPQRTENTTTTEHAETPETRASQRTIREPEPPAPFLPYLGREQHPEREAWHDAYLTHLALNGGPTLAAHAAGQHPDDVQHAIDADPVFAREVTGAVEWFCDLTEWQSLNVGRTKSNPLPFFARLKADRPARYVERAQIASVNLSVAMDASPGDAKALLASLLAAATPTTRREIADRGGLLGIEQLSRDSDAGERPAE